MRNLRRAARAPADRRSASSAPVAQSARNRPRRVHLSTLLSVSPWVGGGWGRAREVRVCAERSPCPGRGRRREQPADRGDDRRYPAGGQGARARGGAPAGGLRAGPHPAGGDRGSWRRAGRRRCVRLGRPHECRRCARAPPPDARHPGTRCCHRQRNGASVRRGGPRRARLDPGGASFRAPRRPGACSVRRGGRRPPCAPGCAGSRRGRALPNGSARAGRVAEGRPRRARLGVRGSAPTRRSEG